MGVTVETTTTYDEAVEAGYWGSVLVYDNPVTGTVDEVVGLDVTSDEYAQGRYEEAHPPDVSAEADTSSAPKADTGSSKASAPKSSSTSKSDA